MGELVNLRKARKTRARRADDLRATENRVLHGRTKAERALDAARLTKSGRDLAAHRIDAAGDKP